MMTGEVNIWSHVLFQEREARNSSCSNVETHTQQIRFCELINAWEEYYVSDTSVSFRNHPRDYSPAR